MNTPSLRLRPLAAAILCSLIAPALFAQTATTTPVGFITINIPAAIDAATPSNTALSIPLYATAAYVSTATVNNATQVTLTGAVWQANQFALPPTGTATTPYIVRLKSGSQTGRFWLITSNTTNQLTVQNPYGGTTDVTTQITNGDSCEVLPANTLASVFGAPSTLYGDLTPDAADNVLLWNGANWDTYYYNTASGFWKGVGRANYNTLPIYPDEGVFVIRRSTASPVALTLMGTVPSTGEKTDLGGSGASTYFSNRFPTDTTLGALGLQTIVGWTAGATSDVADNVFLWNGTSWDSYYWNGTIWKSVGRADQGGTIIKAGAAVFVTRIGAGAVTLSQLLPYTP